MRRQALKGLLLAVLAALLAMGCVDYSAKVVPDISLNKTMWYSAGGTLRLQFVDYDIINFFNTSGATNTDGSSAYVEAKASNFYFYADYIDHETIGTNPPIPFNAKETRIGSWSLSNYNLTLNFDTQTVSNLGLSTPYYLEPPVTGPLLVPLPAAALVPFNAVPDITIAFTVSYASDQNGIEELKLSNGTDTLLFSTQAP